MFRKDSSSARTIAVVVAAFLLLSSLACVCAPFTLPSLTGGLEATATSIAGQIEELVTAVSTQMPPLPTFATPAEGTPAPEVSFEDIPTYPGARRDTEKEADIDELVGPLGATGALQGEAQVYLTPDTPAEVARFYEEEMPRHGWESGLSLVEDEGGIMVWHKEGLEASLVIGVSDGDTVIVVIYNVAGD